MTRFKKIVRGVAAVEFAVVCVVFFTILFAGIEMGRMMWTFNAASEATRIGARMASLCEGTDANKTLIRSRISTSLNALGTNAANNIVIDYFPSTCSSAACYTDVQVSLRGYSFTPLIPFFGLTFPFPSFATSLRRESMLSNCAALVL